MNGGLEPVFRHVRHALRALATVPAFTGTVVLTLALGIGANSARALPLIVEHAYVDHDAHHQSFLETIQRTSVAFG